MKKLSILLIFVLLLTLAVGCTERQPAPTESGAESVGTKAPEPTPTASETPTNSDAPATDGTEPAPDADAVHPMLFHVTGEKGQEAWLFGTIHVGDERIELALNKLKPFLDGCGALAVEFDIVAYEERLMTDFQAQLDYYMPFVITDGTKISDHMPQELYERAYALLGEAGLVPKLMERYNLSMWAQLVEQAAMMTRSSLDMEKGMDRALINYCYDKQIEVRDVESAEFQYGLLADFPDELNLLLIEQTLDSLDDYSDGVNELYDAWLEGSYDGLMAVLESDEEDTAELSEEEQALLESYNEKMLNQRNVGMCYRAMEWLEAGDKVFFAVGAAHLLDDVGLVALLEAEGYTVEQVEY